MTLAELAVRYRSEAEEICMRIRVVQDMPTHGAEEERRKQARLRLLTAMLRDDRDIANICAHYYDRSHHRCARYSI